MFLRTGISIVVLAMAQTTAQARRPPSLLGERAFLAADADNAGLPVVANFSCNGRHATKRRREPGFADLAAGGTNGFGRRRLPAAPGGCCQAAETPVGGNAERAAGSDIKLAELQRAHHEPRNSPASGWARRGQSKVAQLHGGEPMTPSA